MIHGVCRAAAGAKSRANTSKDTRRDNWREAEMAGGNLPSVVREAPVEPAVMGAFRSDETV